MLVCRVAAHLLFSRIDAFQCFSQVFNGVTTPRRANSFLYMLTPKKKRGKLTMLTLFYLVLLLLFQYVIFIILMLVAQGVLVGFWISARARVGNFNQESYMSHII